MDIDASQRCIDLRPVSPAARHNVTRIQLPYVKKQILSFFFSCSMPSCMEDMPTSYLKGKLYLSKQTP